ncbi:neutral zinc metallopeptidase [Nocardiopsis ansamitocini]|uniref:Peptidase n=1 Tax=Nocardiopsis ansamitocini TaxID=1670832 RepID=A0A9W6P4V6_9ACTN|nr:neutral zinc metallopeptidase [Nocardiopsis ansamitocini]GLU47395.1 hypothetical protein Nans01_17460 [Nocardiopsis ansamitocini]
MGKSSRRSATDAGAEYALPVHAAKPRPHLGIGVMVVLITGLGAVALAGFVTVAAFFDGGNRPAPSTAAPAHGPAVRQDDTMAVSNHDDGLDANRLYSSGRLAEVACEAPRLHPRDATSMEVFLHTVTDCLDESWGEHFADSAMPFEPPNRVYWYASGQSPCGNYPVEGTSAFYCQANQGLYLGVADIVETSAGTGDAEAYGFLLSHEYGHHVQGEAGILDRYQDERSGQGTSADRDLWTRRGELQANCLGGVFLGSVADSFPIGGEGRANILKDVGLRSDRGDDRTHGTPQNGQMWTDHGMDRQDPAACNTWDARTELVD